MYFKLLMHLIPPLYQVKLLSSPFYRVSERDPGNCPRSHSSTVALLGPAPGQLASRVALPATLVCLSQSVAQDGISGNVLSSLQKGALSPPFISVLPSPSPCQAELRATLVQSPLPHSGTQPFLRLPLTLLCMLPCHILQLVTFKCSWLITYGVYTTAG